MVQIPQRLLGEALQRSALRFPDKVAITTKNRTYSYSQFRQAAENFANHLIRSGIQKGDRVATYLNNGWENVVSIYGISLAGGLFLVINPETKADKLNYILNDSGAKVLVSSNLQVSGLNTGIANTPELRELIISGESQKLSDFSHLKVNHFEDCINTEETTVPLPAVIPNDLAALIYTSGSTGFPKGVMMTHQSMVFTCWSLIEYLRLDENERIMLVLQLAFDYGLYQLLMSVTIGGTLIIEQPFVFPASVYKSIEQHKPTVFPGVPTIYAMMIASHKESGILFDSVKKITNTAALLPAETIPYLEAIFPNALIFKMYGLTECKRVCYLEPELINEKPASVGKAIPGTEVFLLSPDGLSVKANEPGILYIRGPHVMLGYLNNKDLSARMLKPGNLPGERVLCSNDWFKMDEEGFLYFLGRNDDILKTRGEKVSPVEIENTIYKMDAVKEVAIIGKQDSVMGQAIWAFVTLHQNHNLTEKDVQRHCASYLESYMIPQRIIFLDEMPKSPNGKIDKKELARFNADETITG